MFTPPTLKVVMRAERPKGPAARLLLAGNSPSRGLYTYMAVLSFLYVMVVVHTPMSLLPISPHDDGLFILLARHLSEGNWLGPFDQFTLMKGPGYPLFLAVANALALPVSFAHASFHCVAIAALTLVGHRFVNSMIISGVLFTMLLWHPLSISGDMLRVFREQIYYAQVLLLMATLTYVLFVPLVGRNRLLASALCGAVFGWFWLTREEAVWVLPAVLVLVAVAGVQAFYRKNLHAFVAAGLVIVMVFALANMSFRAMNWFAYGKFVGVDFKEAQFQRALQAVHGIQSGDVRPFVSITKKGREQVYAVSQSFASLAPHLEGSSAGWMIHSCTAIPVSCGEIGAGWFMWAFRDAVAAAGHYSSPSQASAFYQRVADDIITACNGGRLVCAPQLVPEMPPWNWSDVAARLIPSYIAGFKLLLAQPRYQIPLSEGEPEQMAASLRVLHSPLHQPTPEEVYSRRNYQLGGWYYERDARWFSVKVVRPDKKETIVTLERLESPDVQRHFADQNAGQQRFTLRTRCNGACVLRIETNDGQSAERRLDQLSSGMSFEIGFGRLHIDIAEVQVSSGFIVTKIEQVVAHIRGLILTHYRIVWLPVVAVGLIAWAVTTLLYFTRSLTNVCYLLALTSWLLGALRVTLLVLIDITAMPPFYSFYLAPAYYMLVCGALFSVAAWLQLSGRLPVTLRGVRN